MKIVATDTERECIQYLQPRVKSNDAKCGNNNKQKPRRKYVWYGPLPGS